MWELRRAHGSMHRSVTDAHPVQVDNEEAKHYEVERHALFFNDTGAKELYQSYVRYIIGRRNSRTGQLYRDDPPSSPGTSSTSPAARPGGWVLMQVGLGFRGKLVP